ncbi:IclR family transcriptional regulator [Antrihabitans sp. YC2-6]|uniref:IclR family transcriptional regulator n=1 Tax=Antrihabitans sp. YC2-6 TaxID=2799498 RepID=UPI0018F35E3F|nr:IclR family transcriptional regulator [Antrihabitans sp. YC2-6]MBJ8348260.1 IclR family transcriptional regulator [Antrihabitans sp. YC2-6]
MRPPFGELPQYPIESVDRALRLLKLLGSRSTLRLSDARAELDVSQSTAHRLMAMLVYHGFAIQDPTSRVYRAGSALIDFGFVATAKPNVREMLTGAMQRVAQSSGETVHLGLLDGVGVRFVDVVESAQALRVSGRVGRVVPLHATSMGKAMLATMSDDQVRAVIGDATLPNVMPRTITDPDALLREVRRTRIRGYAVNREESEAGVTSVGVAVVDRDQGLLGAMSVATPTSRSSAAMTKKHGDLLVGEVQKVSEQIGSHFT